MIEANFDNVPFGTDYGGYGTGLAVILGLLMMLFYVVNAILLFIALRKNRLDNKKQRGESK